MQACADRTPWPDLNNRGMILNFFWDLPSRKQLRECSSLEYRSLAVARTAEISQASTPHLFLPGVQKLGAFPSIDICRRCESQNTSFSGKGLNKKPLQIRRVSGFRIDSHYHITHMIPPSLLAFSVHAEDAWQISRQRPLHQKLLNQK